MPLPKQKRPRSHLGFTVLLGAASPDAPAALEGLLSRGALVGRGWLDASVAAGRLLVAEGEVERHLLEVLWRDAGGGGGWQAFLRLRQIQTHPRRLCTTHTAYATHTPKPTDPTGLLQPATPEGRPRPRAPRAPRRRAAAVPRDARPPLAPAALGAPGARRRLRRRREPAAVGRRRAGGRAGVGGRGTADGGRRRVDGRGRRRGGGGSGGAGAVGAAAGVGRVGGGHGARVSAAAAGPVQAVICGGWGVCE
jgi:hypothetical protein